LGGDINIAKKNTEALVVVGKEVGLEADTEETKYNTCSFVVTRGQDKIVI
jgi:hypothetical protein